MLTTIEKHKLREACLLLVGKQYVLGAEVDLNKIKPDMKLIDLYGIVQKVDCSELVQVVYKYAAGKVFTDLAANQYVASEKIVPVKGAYSLATGDLCFLANNPAQQNSIGHVGIYIGGDLIVEAKGKNYGVVVSTVQQWQAKSTFAGWRRPRI